MTTAGTPDCLRCKHLIEDAEDKSFICKAFPKGIHTALLYGHIKHNEPLEGDSGIIFEPREDIL